MTSLIAIGAGIAALTGIGAGIGIGLQLPRQQTLSQDSRRLTERSQRHCYLDVHWQRVLQFSVW